MRSYLSLLFPVFFILPFYHSCQKEKFDEAKGVVLKFSRDTLSFDTVFSSTGSSTKRLMIYNASDKNISVESIRLKNEHSSFVVNINGINTTNAKNVSIAAHDSVYVFVQFFKPPSGKSSPLICTDSIICELGGNSQHVLLMAYSQDVKLFNATTLKTQVWDSTYPYLIVGTVVIDSLETLTIQAGTKIYFHKNANLQVKGTLHIYGTFKSPVILKADRLEKDYQDIPGQWGGITLMPGNNSHEFHWLIAENGTSGIIVGQPGKKDNPGLILENCIIRNMAYNCLIAYNTKIQASNCLFANASTYVCGLFEGGNYDFYHCSLVNYYGLYDDREMLTPCLFVSNRPSNTVSSNGNLSSDLVHAGFYNSIVYGSYSDEIALDSVSTMKFSYAFDHCLLKSKRLNNKNTGAYSFVIWNKDPKFISVEKLNFQLDTLSPAKDAGNVQIGKLYPYDLMNNDRTIDAGPDIGSFERNEK